MPIHPSDMATTSNARCGNCCNWMPLKAAQNAGWCKLASHERANHSGINERVGLMTTDMSVCTSWMRDPRWHVDELTAPAS